MLLVDYLLYLLYYYLLFFNVLLLYYLLLLVYYMKKNIGWEEEECIANVCFSRCRVRNRVVAHRHFSQFVLYTTPRGTLWRVNFEIPTHEARYNSKLLLLATAVLFDRPEQFCRRRKTGGGKKKNRRAASNPGKDQVVLEATPPGFGLVSRETTTARWPRNAFVCGIFQAISNGYEPNFDFETTAKL